MKLDLRSSNSSESRVSSSSFKGEPEGEFAVLSKPSIGECKPGGGERKIRIGGSFGFWVG